MKKKLLICSILCIVLIVALALPTFAGEATKYPLYDNGRSLFYEDTEEMVQRAVGSPAAYATSFGFAGTYWDYVQEIAKERGGLSGLISRDITREEVTAILTDSGFTGYRFSGALEWIMKTLELLWTI